MRYVEAPQDYTGRQRSVFLAGGITGCPDWQEQMVKHLHDTKLVVFNPRRIDFPMGDPDAAAGQIVWEHRYLRVASAIAFWFPCETLCPIVLYELGAWSMTHKPILVGVHEQYQRRADVIHQTRLVRPEVRIMPTLERLAESIHDWHSGYGG